MQSLSLDPAEPPAGVGESKARRRVSTNGQKAKKRELDRIAQKKSRERARNRVTELQETIRRLQDDDKQKQISELMGVIEDLRCENERLRSTMEKIRSLTDTLGTGLRDVEDIEGRLPASGRQTSSSISESNTEQVTSPDNQTLPQDPWWNEEGCGNKFPDAFMIDPPPATGTYPTEPEMDLYVPRIAEISPSLDFVLYPGLGDFESALAWGTPGQLCPGKFRGVVPDHEKWRTSNEAIIFGIEKARKMSQDETTIINSHAAYKAILWGCDAREEEERSHPLWLALRLVDEKVFGNWHRKAQKIAMMFVCQRMLLV